MNSRILIPMALIILLPIQFIYAQPQGYTLIYSPARAYYVDWMNVKAVYMKEDGEKLYFYIEYYGAIPSSGEYYRGALIYIDADRNPRTGEINEIRGEPGGVLGADYFIHFRLSGDSSIWKASLSKWNDTSENWDYNIKELTPNMRYGSNYMEIWVDKRDIGYTQNGIDFYIVTWSGVNAIPGADLSYTIGSSIKKIKIDGDPSDWGSISPLVTFPPRYIDPPELEVSSIYVANDDENLYFRIDTRGKPTTRVNGGKLYRYFFVDLDTDNNDNTGHKWFGGAEFIIDASFIANLSKEAHVEYCRYDNWNWYSIENSGDFNDIFEFRIPLSPLGLSSGQTIGILIEGWGGLEYSGHLTYPPNITPSQPQHETIPPFPPEQESPVTKTSSDILYLLPILLLVIPLLFIYRRRSEEKKEEEIVRILLSE
ncbi:hypothetical protein [Candidatus Methanodesulfokora washburnensis]|nr:hypothetical protein [Candidatus Methanodesulfokores washburnensis]